MTNSHEIEEIFKLVIDGQLLKKAVFSRPNDKSVLRAEVRIYLKRGVVMVQLATYTADNKVYHQNMSTDSAPRELQELLCTKYRQCNILTVSGECEIKVNKEKVHVVNRIQDASGKSTEIAEHNKKKQYILPEGTKIPFLYELGIMNAGGRVYDKMQDKFRQINRFLDFIEEVSGQFSGQKTLRILDLCCGKSYLTFAVHHYFTVIRGQKVEMTGVDLKPDVIKECSEIAARLGLQGLTFLEQDILSYDPEKKVDMVISLHACNTATDIVLAGAVRWNAKVILSSPCCHHELSGQLECDALSVITGYPYLREKLCELSTDALRGKMLEYCGYSVQMMEFVDSGNTPKNLLIRAVHQTKLLSEVKQAEKLREYDELCELLGVQPILRTLLSKSH